MARMSWRLLIAVLLLFVIGTNPWNAAGQDQQIIRLGGTISMTGNLANTAKLYIDGRNLAIDTINAQGGVVVNGIPYKLELVQMDDQSDAKMAAGLLEKLITDGKVDFLLGPYSSDLVIQASAVGEKYGVPMVEGGGAASTIFNRGFKYVFGTLPPGPNYLEEPIKLFKDEAHAQTMALVYADDSFSTDAAAGARQWANQFGIKIIVDEKYTNGQTEFSSLIAELKAANPDVIMNINHLAEALAFVKQARSLGLDKDLVFTGPVTTPDFLTLGDLAEGIFGVTPWLPTQNTSGDIFGSAADYAQTFSKRFNYMPDYHNANGTIEVLTFKKAIEAAGSLDHSTVRDAIAKLSYDSFYGKVDFSETGAANRGMIVVQIQDGKVVSVGPGGEAQAKFKTTH
jgi:branched-chain amino acid transport system substrate-binding protein